MGEPAKLSGPDLARGVAASDIPDGGTLLGHAGGEAVLLARRGADLFAVGATCTHYSGPLANGILVGDEIRCPWHHACFDLRTGEAVAAPALNPIPCYRIGHRGDRVIVGEKLVATPRAPRIAESPASVVIVGAGAAGNAAAETLRREGYRGPVTMFGAEETVPVDRPNLSKDYLAGNAPEEWIPLRGAEFYAEHEITLRTETLVAAIDTGAREVVLSDGKRRSYGALLLATGAEPLRLTIPGADDPRVHMLRRLADSRAIIARAATAKHAVVVGASFIGLEVAASLRARNLAVTVVAPEARPLERVLGPQLGDFIRALHEEKDVVFRLGHTLRSIEPDTVTLDDGLCLAADLVVAGIGVRPRLALPEQAKLSIDRGVLVDETLRTSAPDVWAAGDIARYPDRHFGRAIRVEHWVVAERQGQTAARNMLGQREPFRAVPFFWSQHYDVPINYVGHAEAPDRIDVRGSIADRDCVIAYRERGRVTAVASIYRDRESLLAEAAFERDDQAAIEAILDGVRR